MTTDDRSFRGYLPPITATDDRLERIIAAVRRHHLRLDQLRRMGSIDVSNYMLVMEIEEILHMPWTKGEETARREKEINNG